MRILKQACYSVNPIGHYGLNKNYYTHFTSPIRRYADLIVHRILDKYLENNPEISADLIDLRTLSPLDNDSIIQSVRKTGKAIILQEDSLFGGLASEISSIIMENCFENLDAPVIRVGSLDTPIPFEETLEKQYLPFERFESEILKLIDY